MEQFCRLNTVILLHFYETQRGDVGVGAKIIIPTFLVPRV